MMVQHCVVEPYVLLMSYSFWGVPNVNVTLSKRIILHEDLTTASFQNKSRQGHQFRL